MEQVLPASADYSNVLPLSVPAVSKRRRFYPVNGAASYNSNGTNEIRIQIESNNSLLDAINSYLEFNVLNDEAPGGASFGFDLGGAASMFSRVRVEQGGQILSDTREYGRLMASVINPVMESRDARGTETMKGIQSYGQDATNLLPRGTATTTGDALVGCLHNGAAGAGPIGPQQRIRMSMPIMSGLFTQDKLIPLPLINQSTPLTVILTMEIADNCGCWDALPAVVALPPAELWSPQ